MRVMITGSLGYVGVEIVPLALAQGMDVVGIDSDLYNGCDYGRPVRDNVTRICDVRDLTVADLYGFDAVIHLAGLSNDPLGDINPSLTDDINRRATVELAAKAKRAGVPRFLFSSSCSNYGASEGGWLTEDCPVNPITPYAVSKLRSERDLALLADDSFSPVYLRSGTAFGLSPRLRFDLVVNNLTAWAVATGQIRLKSDGSAWRPLVHVSDMARAFLTVLQAPRADVHGQAFNVGSRANNMTVRDVARIIEEELDGAQITFAPAAEADTRTYRVDTTRLERLGFSAQVSVREGVRELRDAFRVHGVSVADFEGTRYKRVDHVRHLIDSGAFGADLKRVSGVAA